MSVFPGFCGDFAVTPFRVFLGTLPNLAVEERLLRQLQPVFAWYSARKRVKEQANEFVEVDLASCDPELLLRYCHVYYTRRQIFDELIDKQLTVLETGKAPKVANSALLACLNDCNALILPRLQYEQRLLMNAKKACVVPYRRELKPDSPLEPHDALCMMRVVEEDVSGVPDAEMQARAYLPREAVEKRLGELVATLFGSDAKPALDKKDQKLLQRLVPGDYSKVGCTEKWRPVDVTTVHRFIGERLHARVPADQFFRRSLWGHVFRKYATHPGYLSSASLYWARQGGLHPNCPLTTMPIELAEAVCVQQNLFPALKFRAQFLYTSPDIARQMWRTDYVVPLMRLYPALGAPAAEDLAACTLVEAEWAKLALTPETNPMQESVVRAVKQFVEQAGTLYETNHEAVLKRVEESVKLICPPLSEAETEILLHGESGAAAAATATAHA